ncbi:anti-sigma factor family protein [Microtetraspora malaysiensis]|uniref:Anti-sigma factor family protein n=1 Tax=Microtetraspora malaysiensis TaxID=161358 RepID=A0ABW6SG82_9ACTN
MTCDDDVRISLGGYVLGALDDEETAAVEVHLDECPDCMAELAELSGLPPLLAQVTEEDIRNAAEPPRQVLDRLLAATVRRRRRSRITLALAASVAVVALGGTTWMATARQAADTSAGSSSIVSAKSAPEASAAARTDAAADSSDKQPKKLNAGGQELFGSVAPTTASARQGGVEVTVQLTPDVGGTRVEATVTGLRAGAVVRLTAVGADRRRSAVASWSADAQGVGATSVTFGGSTELPLGEITRFELATADGRTLVTLPVKHGE